MNYIAKSPATIANVFTGFDILGFAIDSLYDTVTVRRAEKGVSIYSEEKNIPTNPKENTAGFPLLKMIEDYNLDFGFEVIIDKGIPLSAGLGGSAASSVAAVSAASVLLEDEGYQLSKSDILNYALDGESVASGSKHGDNVAASLNGGFTAFISADNRHEIIDLPILKSLYVAVIHPEFKIHTIDARNIINPNVSLKMAVEQQVRLTTFISACYSGDFDLFEIACKDVLIEPQRAHLIPKFNDIQQMALTEGAWGCSISGAGPSVFALCRTQSIADNIIQSLSDMDLPYHYESFISKLPVDGTSVRREN